MTGSAADVIRIAKAEVGYREGRTASGSWNNDQKYSNETPGLAWSDFQAWCQTFQSWVALRAGTDGIEPRTASCRTACDWFKQRGRFSEYPAIGAQVFFGSGGGTHVGRVYAYDASYAYTIEGNTNDNGSAEGNGVYLRKRLRRDPYLHGYGYPAYAGGIVSADPAWRGQVPSRPVVSASKLTAAARTDPPRSGTPVSYAGVRTVEDALVAEGLLARSLADGHFGSSTVSAYRLWQQRCGYSGSAADGIPGLASLRKLGSQRGFEVAA